MDTIYSINLPILSPIRQQVDRLAKTFCLSVFERWNNCVAITTCMHSHTKPLHTPGNYFLPFRTFQRFLKKPESIQGSGHDLGCLDEALYIQWLLSGCLDEALYIQWLLSGTYSWDSLFNTHVRSIRMKDMFRLSTDDRASLLDDVFRMGRPDDGEI